MPLIYKIFAPNIVLLVLVAGILSFVIIDYKAEERGVLETTAQIEKHNNLSRRLIAREKEEAISLLLYRFDQNEAHLAAVSAADAEIANIIDSFTGAITSPRGEKLLAKFVQSKRGSNRIKDELIAAIQSKNEKKISLAFNRWLLKLQQVETTLADLDVFNMRKLETDFGDIQRRREQFSLVMAGLAWIVVLFIVLTPIYFSRAIGRPIKKLTDVATGLSRGDLALRLDGVERRDEIGWLAQAFNQMVSNLVEANTALEHEVTERKRAEGKLRQSQEQLQGIMDNVVDGIVTIDEEGLIESFNPSAGEIFGYSVEEIRGQNIKILMPEPYHSEHDDYIQNYLRTGQAKVLGVGPREIAGQRKDGSAVPLELAISEMRIGERRIFIGTLRDITDRKSAEAQLQQAQKMEAVGQLTGGVAHDFNNLLAIILGNTELLAEDAASEDPRMQAILRASERGAELTQRLLAFSRQQPLNPQVINLADLTTSMLELLRRTLGETIDIETTTGADLWAALADPGQVENALLNLAINARDAMPKGGELTIECVNARLDKTYVSQNPDAVVGDYVVLELSDTGTGMSAEVQAHAFEPFFTTKKVGQGSGLGLSMVYGFAKQSGGHLKIYSEENTGTTVKLYLPCAEEVEVEVEVTKTSIDIARGQGEVILVIEDDADVRALAVRMLESLGYRVIDVPNAAEARDALRDRGKVDLVLSDVFLPGGTSGPEFVEEAIALYPGLRSIFMSGYPAESAKRNGFLGSDKVLLNKRFQKGQLAKVLREALDRGTIE